MNGRFSSGTGRIALGGVLSALAVGILYFAAMIPSGRIGLTALAGLCPVFAVLFSGRSTGYLVWISASLLGLFIVPEKMVPLCFLTLFGLYPVLKSKFECISSPVACWICKILFGIAGVVLIQVLFMNLFMLELPEIVDRHDALVDPIILLVFIAYDIGLSRLIQMMSKRLGI